IDLSDASVSLHQLGDATGASLKALTPAEQASLRLAEATKQISDRAHNASTALDPLAQAADRLAKSQDRLTVSTAAMFGAFGLEATSAIQAVIDRLTALEAE